MSRSIPFLYLRSIDIYINAFVSFRNRILLSMLGKSWTKTKQRILVPKNARQTMHLRHCLCISYHDKQGRLCGTIAPVILVGAWIWGSSQLRVGFFLLVILGGKAVEVSLGARVAGRYVV